MPKSNEPTDEPQDDTPGATMSLSCDDVLDRLDFYLDTLDGSDGSDEGLPGLDQVERAAVRSHLTHCPACAQDLSRARRIRDGLRALPEVPDVSIDLPTAPPRLQPGPWLRWGVPLAAATVLVVAVLLALPGRFGDPAPPSTAAVESGEAQVSPEELARAELEARYALARLAEATRRARREIREDILTRHVVAPVQRELLRSFQAPPELDPAMDPDSAGRNHTSL